MVPSRLPFIIFLSFVAISSWYLTRLNTPIEDDSLSFNPIYQRYYLEEARILGNDNNLKTLAIWLLLFPS